MEVDISTQIGDGGPARRETGDGQHRHCRMRAQPSPPPPETSEPIVGSRGSTRYQWPRSISPVTPPRASVAERAGHRAPTWIAWIKQRDPGGHLEDPGQLAVPGPDQRPSARRMRASRTHHVVVSESPAKATRAATDPATQVKPGPTIRASATRPETRANPAAQATRMNRGSASVARSSGTADDVGWLRVLLANRRQDAAEFGIHECEQGE